MPSAAPRPKVLIFDVNETLLDIAPVKQAIDDLLLEPDSSALWFSTLLHHSLVMSVADRHADFMDIGVAALQMVGRNRDMAIDDADARQLLSGMRSLAPHPDVVPALERLQRAGFRLATLTNSSQAAVKAQLDHAELTRFFEQQLSVETPQRFKPHASVYRWAVGELDAQPADCMLVAAHGWDVAGAKWAGLQAAFIARIHQQQFPLAEPPDIDVADFSALADALGA